MPAVASKLCLATGGVPPVPTAAVAIPPGLNGGHLPARAVVAAGPWCYQPPPARLLATADAVGGATPRHAAEVEMDDAPTAQKRGLDTEVVFEDQKRRRLGGKEVTLDMNVWRE